MFFEGYIAAPPTVFVPEWAIMLDAFTIGRTANAEAAMAIVAKVELFLIYLLPCLTSVNAKRSITLFKNVDYVYTWSTN
jgi:hypothetical protein